MVEGAPRRDRVLVVVLAGGAGSRLGALTERRAKPVLPFGGMYRLIDITLSNVSHSGLSDVWVVEQYQPHTLNDHLANGRPWDLDRTHGGLQILPPFEGGHGDGFAAGNADAVAKQRPFIERFAPDVVVTMSADHVYRLDLRDVLDAHRRTDASLTIVTTTLPHGDDPSRFAWVSTDGAHEITAFEYKPDEPSGDEICTEVFVFDGPTLLDALPTQVGDEPLGDYGDRLIPQIVDGGSGRAFRLDGYWRDVGTIGAYHAAHMELLGHDPPLRLDDPAWPMLTGSIVGGPAAVTAGASVSSSLLSPGCRVGGSVVDCVLGRGVTVEAGASLRETVVLDDAMIRSGAIVERAIVDIGADVEPGWAKSQPPVDEASGVVVLADRADG